MYFYCISFKEKYKYEMKQPYKCKFMKTTETLPEDTHGIQKKEYHAVSVLIPVEDFNYLKSVAEKRRGLSVSCLIREIIGKSIDSGFGE